MRASVRHRFPLWTFPVAAFLLVALWQWATVAANYGGNWTALFCTGALKRHPPLVAAEHIYLFANSTGYDGQFYQYIAHDPLLRSDLKHYVDDPRMRYHRILVPLLAYGLAWGQPALIDPAYELVCLLSIGLGVYWCCGFALNAGLSPAWGLLFLAMPAIPITIDRLVVDGALAALTAAFLYYDRLPPSRSKNWKMFAVLACAALARETGFLLVLAYCAYLTWRREFRMACQFVFSAAPAIAWYVYVQANTSGATYRPSFIPFKQIARALAHPSKYPASVPFLPAVAGADYLAFAGVLLAFGFALLWFVRVPYDPARITAALFAIMALFFQITGQWENVYTYGRIYTPVLLCLAAIGAEQRNPWLLLPVAMLLPRIAIQFAPQVLGIIHWLN
ncbi:MAG: hypothetical protein WBE37_15525 [Bryobacteraceae bacterium]